MSLQHEVAVLKDKIVKATVDSETWRSAGNQEKYMENCLLVEMLEQQLDVLYRERTQ
ncbi:hypothetical protein OOT46_25470 [Aquabacterium sp. A7-Y]|uniref:hypothetical protein n=1 Tax=Aquabacterium sp. A7-Y TaxID=1349605 RepID=UPI00223D707B|nr:hypothetical protein [Aquabacterium sp. A7-Y]MCW7541166.1 hypothetical protein [Aquabacterium sp. A7-Y]